MGQFLEEAEEIIRRCKTLAECTEEPGHITRTFLSEPMHEVHRRIRGWMEAAGLRTWVDAAGNLRAVIGNGPRLMIGSHLDSVPHGGAFDGVLGVMLGIALVKRWASQPRDWGLEVVGFSEEEGVRFGVPFIGSRALVGDPVMDDGVLDAIRAFGADPAQLPQAAIGDDVKAYLEFHIEQGPVLEMNRLSLGVVQTIVGQSRYELTFRGKANHAGTTPMNRRSDALAAAAEWIRSVEWIANERPGLVATVGRLEVAPGAANVIAGLVRASLDVRSDDNAVRAGAVKRILMAAQDMVDWRTVTATYEQVLDVPAVPMDPAMVRALRTAVRAAGYKAHLMASGAGHDAMILARKVPSAMLLLRSPGGISHHPAESVLAEDVEAALAVGRRFLDNWRPS
ncbi:MAG TPA: allantoate amidohydrolase [Bryobacteraceae bacterium]|nr:allantoate amidohydrolase [Bryobacteraceae bacterium]